MIETLSKIELPETLYKFRYWESKFHRQILQKQIAYFASPATFNDPFDCKIPIRYDINSEKQLEDIYFKAIRATNHTATDSAIRDFSKNFVHTGPVNPKIFRKNDKEYFDDLYKRMGVLSLTSQRNDILMWGHYANSHQGFCLGLDTAELLKHEDINFIGKVKYFADFPIIVPNGDQLYNLEMQIFSKWDKWQYEDEYRLAITVINDRKIKLPNTVYKEIILGCNMPQNTRKDIIKLVKKKFPTMSIYEAKPNDEKFLIEIQQID